MHQHRLSALLAPELAPELAQELAPESAPELGAGKPPKPTENTDRRRAPRERLASPIGLQILDPVPGPGGRVAGVTADVSDVGVGVFVWSPLPRGTRVVATLGSFLSDAQMGGVVRACIPDDFNAFRLSIEFEAGR